MDGLNHEIDNTRFGLAVACITGCTRSVRLRDLAHPRYHRLKAHAERLLHDRFGDLLNTFAMSPKTSREILKVAQLLMRQMQYQSAERMYQRALAGSQQALGPKHLSTLDFLCDLGHLYRDQGRPELAEQYLRRVLAGYEQILRPDDLHLLESVRMLERLYRDQGKLELAEQLLRRALGGYEQKLDPGHPSTLRITHSLGGLYSRQNRLELAEQYLKRTLTGREQTLGPEHRLKLSTLEELGFLYWKQNRLKVGGATPPTDTERQRAVAGSRTPVNLGHC